MLWDKVVFCLEVLIYKRLQMWRHNDVIYSQQFLFKSAYHTWRYERECKWVFFSEHSVERTDVSDALEKTRSVTTRTSLR